MGKNLCEPLLLRNGAVYFCRYDDGIGRGNECIFGDGRGDILDSRRGSQGASVSNHGLAIIAIVNIHYDSDIVSEEGMTIKLGALTLNASAAREERANVSFHSTITNQLMADEVRVVRARDEVVRDRQRHILGDIFVMV